MDKTQINRHTLIYVTEAGQRKIWQNLAGSFSEEAKPLVKEALLGPVQIPGFARRAEIKDGYLPIGFVPCGRLNGNRLRIATYAKQDDVMFIISPYELVQRKVYVHKPRTKAMKIVIELCKLAAEADLQVGILGSAALELATNLPYTDDASDIDLLIKPAPYEKLKAFYCKAQDLYTKINMDFELDLPNGYGIKLAEIFMCTQTVLGKSIMDVALLERKTIMQYLK